MPTKAKTKPPTKSAALVAVRKQTAKLDASRAQSRAVRDALDAEILAARNAGATYREIAAAASLSTAWVQASLERSGYQTTPR